MQSRSVVLQPVLDHNLLQFRDDALLRRELNFDEAEWRLTTRLDFRRGARFAHPDDGGAHSVHDTQIKRYRHLNFFEHECLLEAPVPRVRLSDDRVALIRPPWAGKLSGFTLLFESLILAMCREMPFSGASTSTARRSNP